jgi:diguanylate cyclase (GGDEF)-like protein/PAS domain S-box-containing protein
VLRIRHAGRRLLEVVLGRRGARQRLLEAEERYRTLVEQLPLVTYIDALTETASSMYMSPQVEALLDYPAVDWLGDPEFFAKVLHPDDRERVLALVDHCNRTADPFRADYRLIARDGRTVWVQDESLVQRSADGRLLFTQGYLLDITERKEAEQRLAAEHGVARVLAEAVTVEEATVRIVAVLRTVFGWKSVVIRVLDREAGAFPAGSPEDEWSEVPSNRVRTGGDAVWTPAENVAVYAEPIRAGAELIGVIALRLDTSREPGAALTRTIAMIASQVGQFIDRKQSEHAVHESEARKRAILDSALDCVITVDHDGRIIEFNPAAERAFGRSLAEVRGRGVTELLIPARLQEVAARTLRQCVGNDASGLLGRRIETEALRADGSEFPIELTVVRVDLPGPPLLTAYARDITDRRAAEEGRARAETELRHLALHDGLTGLPNRILFHDRVMQALARSERNGAPFAVLLMDLDRFKEVNDTLGHHTGDALLHELGDRLLACVRPADTVARLGGDEFGFLLDDMAADEAVEVVDRIQATLGQPFPLQRLLLEVEASIGIALFPEHGDSVDLLLQRADVAMYSAKRSGSQFAFYDAAQDDHTPARLTMIGDLRRAIEERELVLHYQPQIDLGSRDVTGVEALLRWQHPERGLLSPDEFVPVAERSGLMHALTRYVIDEALRQRAHLQRLGFELTVAVNASMRNCVDGSFPADVAELLERHATAPTALELEITEHAVIADGFRAKAVLDALSRTGVTIAIDDFGTGYSSLAFLRRLPLKAIKVDRSFVADMTTDHDDAVIVRATIDLARNLGLRVVAEGVETQAVLAVLTGLGCDAAQGFLISQPLAPERLIEWLTERRKNPDASRAA